ncbi:hypothetical protein HD554DRAFT_2042829 [Boletus coccyginus]|nr:hypothetical protein HD554DRAFT_2042829 [Boletus coccyginus]
MASLAGKRNSKMQVDINSALQASSNLDVSIQWCLQPTKWQGQNIHAYCPMDLDIIVEDDLSNFANIDVASDCQYNPMLAKHIEDLASTLYVTDNVNAQPVDKIDPQDEEVFNIGNVSLSDSGCGSEDDDMDNDDDTPLAGHWQNPRSGFQPIKPTTQPVKLLKRKPVLKLPTSAYDHDTCIFDIEYAICQQDGTNSSFWISSFTLLNSLCNLIAEKLEWFPGHVHLRYHLDSDKVKASTISIQTEDELKIFKNHMQNLLVPSLFASGKKLSHIMKKICMDQQNSDSIGNKGAMVTWTGGGKQNSLLGNTKIKARLKDLIEDLQQY